MAADQTSRQPTMKLSEVRQAIGDEGKDATGAKGVDLLNRRQRIGKISLIASGRSPVQLGREENAVDRPKAEKDTIEGLRWCNEIPNIELDVWERVSSRSRLREALGEPGQRINAGECGGCRACQTKLEEIPAAHRVFGQVFEVFCGEVRCRTRGVRV